MTLLHSWKNRARVTYFPSIIMVHEIFGVFLYTRNVNYLVKNEHKKNASEASYASKTLTLLKTGMIKNDFNFLF